MSKISVRVCDVEQDSLQLVKLYQAHQGDSWFQQIELAAVKVRQFLIGMVSQRINSVVFLIITVEWK